MPLIGVSELKEQTSEVIRLVREERAEYVITYKGKPVAVILPLDAERGRTGKDDSMGETRSIGLEEYECIAQELRDDVPEGLSTQEAIDAIRR